MPTEDRIGVGAAFQERHPRLYSLLLQFLIAIITFYCASAIARYGPELDPAPASAVPGTLPPLNARGDANSTRPHICPNGAREDLVDFGPILSAITPYPVLCPSTPFFLLCLLSFIAGIFKFNSLHTSDFDLIDGYGYFIIVGLISLDWKNVVASFQITTPMLTWCATILLPVMHWVCKRVFPGAYGRYREMRREQKEEWSRNWKIIKGGERVGDVEAEAQGADGGQVVDEGGVDEETPLTRDGGRTGLDT